jgi:hypothetical protein
MRKTGFHRVERLMLLGLLIFALVFQGYASQTHFHNDIDFLASGGLSLDSIGGAHHGLSAGDPANNPTLPPDNDDDCPVCHAVALDSVTVLPQGITVSISRESVSIVDFKSEDIGHDNVFFCEYLPRGPPFFISPV